MADVILIQPKLSVKLDSHGDDEDLLGRMCTFLYVLWTFLPE